MSDDPSIIESGEPAAQGPADPAPAGALSADALSADAPADPGPAAHVDPGTGTSASPSEAPRDVAPSSSPSTAHSKPIAPKEYYSISEVCELVGLKPHVLRYWESQFPVLNPSKNRSGNRVYQRKEIKLVLLVQHLLYKEKYTIEGARQRIEQLRRGGELSQATSQALDGEMRKLLRDELQDLLRVLTGRPPRPPRPDHAAAHGRGGEGAAG